MSSAKSKRLRSLSSCILLLILASTGDFRAFAQGTITSTLLGRITDSSGGVIGGASVTVINLGTGLTRQTVTNADGNYLFPFLPPGQYQLTVEKQGFKRETRKGITLELDQRARLEVVLAVGQRSEEVTVTGEPPLLKLDSSDIGEVINERNIVELPLNGRQFIQLALLTPGAIPMPEGAFTTPFALAGGSPNVNGNRSDANNYLLDGVSIIDQTFHNLSISPSVDAIQEFKVQSSLYSAEFGSAPGAQVNIAVKSGSNSFHGGVWEFLRNDAIDAKNFFDGVKPPFRQNQFGTNFSGPLARNKAFFFLNYEGLRIRKGVTIPSTVPSVALRSGDFTGLPPVIDPRTNAPFPNNMIPPGRINSVSTALLNRIPLPNRGGIIRNFVGFGNRRTDSDQGTVRFDHNLSGKNSLFARATISNISNTEPIPGAAAFQTGSAALRPPGFGQTTELNGRNIALQHTHVFTQNLLNQARLGYQYTRSFQAPENPVDFVQANGIAGPQAARGVPIFSITGFSLYGDNGFDLNWKNNTYSFADDLSYTRGSHSIRSGFSVDWLQVNPQFFFIPRGQFNFTNMFTGNSFADFLLGLPFTAQVGVGDPRADYRATSWGAYLQDDWKVTASLTLNLGVRYEYYPPVIEKNLRSSNLDLATGNFVIPSKGGTINASAKPQNFPTLMFVTSEAVGYPRNLIDSDTDNFAPRVGFSYSPFSNHKTAIRGGYGIFYSRGGFSPISIVGALTFNPPFFGSFLFRNPTSNRVQIQGALVAPGSILPAPQVRDRKGDMGYVQEWSLSVEHEYGSSLAIEVEYVGSKGTKLDEVIQANQARLGPEPLTSRVRYPKLATTVSVAGPYGWSTYHALTLQARKRLSHGLSLNANYTWSKSLDTQSLGFSTDANSNRPMNSLNIAADYGPSIYDVRHRVVINYVYELPIGPGKKYLNIQGFAGKVLEGWQLNGIFVGQTGTPFSPLIPTDRSNTGGFQDRPNEISDPNSHAPHTPDKWFNTGAFTPSTPGTFGSAGRNTIVGPGFCSYDFSVFKNTRIRETQLLQFRIEAFNLANHPNFNLPNRTFGSPDFAAVFSAKDAREIQFGLKYTF